MIRAYFVIAQADVIEFVLATARHRHYLTPAVSILLFVRLSSSVSNRCELVLVIEGYRINIEIQDIIKSLDMEKARYHAA